MILTPEQCEKLLIIACANYNTVMEDARVAGYPHEKVQEALDLLTAAALAYARPIVCEECARIAEQAWRDEETGYDHDAELDGDIGHFIDKAADAIREHGKGDK